MGVQKVKSKKHFADGEIEDKNKLNVSVTLKKMF